MGWDALGCQRNAAMAIGRSSHKTDLYGNILPTCGQMTLWAVDLTGLASFAMRYGIYGSNKRCFSILGGAVYRKNLLFVGNGTDRLDRACH